MKKQFLLFALLSVLCSIRVVAQDSITFIRRSSEILDLLKSQKFDEVNAKLDSAVAVKMDSARIGIAWRRLVERGGTLSEVLDTVYEHQANYDVVVFKVLFGKLKMDIKTVYGKTGTIKGLFFLQSDPRERYANPPYYHPERFEETTCEVGEGDVHLKGLLTVPIGKGKVPAVILVHGSGPNDKDESVGSTKIFKDLAVGLAGNGIAVLRYDKRTRGMAALFARKKPILTPEEETLEDAVAAADVLKKDPRIDTTRIYYVGHSLGACFLPQIALRNPAAKGLVLLSPHARPLEDMIVAQGEYILSLEKSASPYRAEILDSLHRSSERIKALTPANAVDSTRILGLHPAYWLYLNKYDGLLIAKTIPQPILVLHGNRDYQVSDKDFNAWKSGLKGKANAEFKSYKDLNHFYVKGSGKSIPAEYNKAGNVSETVINDISGWIAGGKLPK